MPTEPFSNVDDLNSLFEQLGVEDACVIGMFSGGRLAIIFALEHPEKVRSLGDFRTPNTSSIEGHTCHQT